MDTDLASLISLKDTPAKTAEETKKPSEDILEMLKKQGREDSEKKVTTSVGQKKKVDEQTPKGKKRKQPVNTKLQPYNAQARKKTKKSDDGQKKKKKKKAPEAAAPVVAPVPTPVVQQPPRTLIDCIAPSKSDAPAPPPPPSMPKKAENAPTRTLKETIMEEYIDLTKKIQKQEARKLTLEKRRGEPDADLMAISGKQFVTDVLISMYKKQQLAIIEYFPHCYMDF